MEYIPFRRNGIKVSRACLGTMTFGNQCDEATAQEIVRICVDAGVIFFDTADAYSRGASEVMLGRALKGIRQNVVISTKVRGAMGDGPNHAGLSRLHITEAIDASLRRLGTDYVDIYLLHQPDYDTPFEETLEAMAGLVRAGKVRYIGCSNYASWQLVQAHWIADRRNLVPLTVAQPMYNLLARGIEQEFLPACLELGVGTMVYNPIAGGFLSGKYASRTVPDGTRFDVYRFYRDRYWHTVNFEAVEALTRIASDVGLPLLDFSIQWCLQQAGVHVTILGASKPEQIRQSLRVFEKSRAEMQIPAAALAACDAVWEKCRVVAPRYNR